MPEDTNRNREGAPSGANPNTRPVSRSAGQGYASGANRPAARPQGSSRPQGYARTSGGTRPPVRRRKKKKASGRFYGFLALLAVLVVAVIIILPRLGAGGNPAPVNADPTQSVQTDPAQAVASAPTAAITPAPAPVYQPADPLDVNALNRNAALDGTWRSILLLGTDTRYWDDVQHTDTMVVVCYNTQTGAIRMASVMRDTFVVNDTGSKRINLLKSEGGAQLLISTLNEKLGLNISEYMLVNFNGFRNLIDTLGGIDVDITETEMEYINSSLVQQVNLLIDKRYRESTLESNTMTTFGPATHLNGLQALAYARIRKSDSDFKRTERQRTVIMKAVEKAIDTVTIVQMTQMCTTMMQYVETNLTLNSLCGLGLSVVQHGIDDFQQTRLPVNDSYVGETRGQTWGMYDVDWDANRREMQSLLNGY